MRYPLGKVVLMSCILFFCVMLLGALSGGGSVHAGQLLHDLSTYHESLCAQQSGRVPEIFCGMKPIEVHLIDPEGETYVLHALLARTSQQRAAGYQYIPAEVMARTAILFEFEREIVGAFHMCNVEAPLDIVWVRGDEKVLDAVRMLPGARRPAGGCRDIYAPERPGQFLWALETPAGLLEAVGFDLANPWGWRIVVD